MLLVAFTATFTAPADAEPLAPQRWLARYTAEAGCPDEKAFREALESRLGRAPESALGHVRLTVELSRAAGAQAWRGQLLVTDAADLTTTREVEDASCEAVVHALTLVAALSGTADDNEPSEPDPNESGLPSSTAAGVSELEDTPPAPAPTRSDALRRRPTVRRRGGARGRSERSRSSRVDGYAPASTSTSGGSRLPVQGGPWQTRRNETLYG